MERIPYVLFCVMTWYIVIVNDVSYAEELVKTFEQINVFPVQSNSTFKTVCYYSLPDTYNGTSQDPVPRGLNATLCSYIILLPCVIDNNRIVPRFPSHQLLFTQVIPILRQLNPALKILVSNSGAFDPVMQSMQNISEFVNSSLVFLRKYGFDGLDMDWEFPGWPVTSKPHGQIHNFSIVLTELRKAFEEEAAITKKERLLLTAAVSAGKSMAETIYEFEYLKQALDFVNMMGYDYNGWGPLNPLTAYNSPLFAESYDKHFFNTKNLAWSATYWGSKIGKDKVMVGIPFYCHAYRLLSPAMHGYHALGIGLGECDQTGYTCACLAIKNRNATRVFDSAAKVPYCYYGKQWVSYDDENSLSIKTKWILENEFGGVMIFSMNTDDYDGVCDGKSKYPLMTAVLKTIDGYKH